MQSLMLISNLNMLPMFKQGSTITDTRVVAAVRDAMLLQLVLRQLVMMPMKPGLAPQGRPTTDGAIW